MNILSSKQFENRLAENSFSETSKYRVLLVSQLIFWFLNLIGSYLIGSSASLNIKSIFLTVTIKTPYLLIVFIGIKACYSINKRIDSIGFIERFTLLFFPIGLKFLLFAAIICVIIGVVLRKVFFILGISSSIIKFFEQSFPYFASFFIVSVFFFMLYRSFLRLEQKITKIKDKSSERPVPKLDSEETGRNRP